MLPREVGMQDPVVHLPEPEPQPRPVLAELSGASLPGASLPPPGLSSGPDALALFKAFRRRWLLALVLAFLAAGGAAAAVWFFLPANYSVFAQLHIASTEPSVLGNKGADGRGDYGVYLKTQLGKIRSRYVLFRALNRDDVKRLAVIRQHPDPVAWIDEELKVESPDGSELVTVSMNGSDPAELMPIINAITKAYLDDVEHNDRDRRIKRVDELQKFYDNLHENLRTKRNVWHEKAKGLNGGDPQVVSQKQVMLLNAFGELRRQHAQVRFDLMARKNKLEAYKAQEKLIDTLPIAESVLSNALDADPMIRQYEAQMNKWDEVVSHYKQNARYPEKETGYIQANKQLQELKQKIEARKEELRTILVQRFRQQARAEYEGTLIQLQNEIGPLEKQQQDLLADVQRVAEDADKIGNTTTEFEMLTADIKRDEQTSARIGEQLEQLKVELRQAPRVSLVHEAAVQRKDRKRMLMAMIGAPLVAFLGVCFAVSFWEFRGRRIQTPDEVLTGIGLRVVGSVPALPRNASVPLLPSPEEQGAFEHTLLESIDGIRTLLLRDTGSRVLMVTSAVSGEGKTTLATHLAGSLARAGRRTLLIDCDLRRPSIHQLFELPPQPGLSEVLLGEVHLAEATLATPIDGLWVVPAGLWDRNVMQALARDGARGIFEKLKTEYDFVIVDSHPVLPAADSLLIGQHVDAVIFSLLRDVSQMPKVYSACQRLTSLGVRVLGAVVNGTKEETYGDSYQYSTATPQS